MEERPRAPRNLPEEDTAPQQESRPASPGELFLKKWMGIAPERAEAHHSSNYHDGSKFKGWFRETLFPGSEAAEGREEPENTDDREEAYFDKRHEAKDAQQPAGSTGSSGEPEAAEPEPSAGTEAHHISEVIGERAKDMEDRAASRQADAPFDRNKTSSVQSTLGQYAVPVGVGFLAAILILLWLIIGGR